MTRLLTVRRLGLAMSLFLAAIWLAEEPGTLRIEVDVLEKPETKITGLRFEKSYPQAQGPRIQRLLWEPRSKFHYRIKKTHVLTGAAAEELFAFTQQQIANKSPTGWCGHEAEYALTVWKEDEVTLRITFSKQSGSSVYLKEGKPRIGHFQSSQRILTLLEGKELR